jgi:hypothetical protein
MGYCAVPALIFVSAPLLWPMVKYEARQDTTAALTSPGGTTRAPAASKRSSLEGKPFSQQATSMHFILCVLFTAFQLLHVNLYIGTVDDQVAIPFPPRLPTRHIAVTASDAPSSFAASRFNGQVCDHAKDDDNACAPPAEELCQMQTRDVIFFSHPFLPLSPIVRLLLFLSPYSPCIMTLRCAKRWLEGPEIRRRSACWVASHWSTAAAPTLRSVTGRCTRLTALQTHSSSSRRCEENFTLLYTIRPFYFLNPLARPHASHMYTPTNTQTHKHTNTQTHKHAHTYFL